MVDDRQRQPTELADGLVASFNSGAIDDVAALVQEDATWTLRGTLPVSGVWVCRRRIVKEFLPIGAGYVNEGAGK